MKKIVPFMLLFVVLAVGSILIGELFKVKNTKEENADDTATQTDVHIDGYSYADVEQLILVFAKDEEQSGSLTRLVDPLNKSQTITYGYMKKVLEIVGVDDEACLDMIKEKPDDSVISIDEFDRLYELIVCSGQIEGIYKKTIYVFEKDEKIYGEGLKSTYIGDGYEEYLLEAEFDDVYLDSLISCYVHDNSIYRINGFSEESYTLSNVWVLDKTDDSCEVLLNGITKQLPLLEGTFIKTGVVADLIFTNAGVSNELVKEADIEAKVLRTTEDTITLEGIGTFDIDSKFQSYNILGSVTCEDSIPVLAGYTSVKCYTNGNSIYAAVVDKEIVSSDIRVLISNSDYTSYEHQSIKVSCDTDYKLCLGEEEQLVGAGTVTELSYDTYPELYKLRIEPVSSWGQLEVLSIERQKGAPSYHGSIELILKDEYMYIVNEVPLEEYLYSVVSSEMPAYYPEEALKAMAICTRGYAYYKMSDGSFSDYEADIDDSTLCQMYNNVGETPETIKAVKDTYGMVCTYDDTPIVPFYHSTSFGVSCTNDEIWGGNAYEYLVANVENLEKDKVDLSTDEAFRSFLEDSMGYDIIDKDMPYYRWSVVFSAQELTESVNAFLLRMSELDSDYVKLKDENDIFRPTDISDIGAVKSIEVKERSVSGVVQKLEIVGENGTIEVTGQSNIRNIMNPVNLEIVKQDGSVATGWTSLPSPFYCIDKTGEMYTIKGGGFGHGAGMSQNGAMVLAEQGYNYKYILNHYFAYIDLSFIYEVTDEE